MRTRFEDRGSSGRARDGGRVEPGPRRAGDPCSHPRSARFLVAATLCLAAALAPAAHADGWSLRFYGNGRDDIDRVKIPIDSPQAPADIGAGDSTIEFWVKANPGENGSQGCGEGVDGWIYGNILLDRDIWGAGDYGDFGLSLFREGVAFGVSGASGFGSLCGATPVDDGLWHHVAVTRSGASGVLALYGDGQPDALGAGPTGNLSYRDGRSGMPNDPFLVLGAEKHDAGPEYPSFRGCLDELRLSTTVRYEIPFTRPTAPLVTDVFTVALYHFDEGVGFTAHDQSAAPGGPSHGLLRYGGDPAGPVWSGDTPFGVNSGGTCPPGGCGTIPADGTLRWDLRVRPNPCRDRAELGLYVFALENGLPLAITPETWAAHLGLALTDLTLLVYDAAGREVAAMSPSAGEGALRFFWSGETRGGQPLPRGVYWAALPRVPQARARILLLR